MTKKSDAPAIRFKGFSDAWEQRKLSEITDKVTEKNAGLQYVETFTNSAEFGIISQRDFFDHDIAKLGSLDGYYIVKTEDFVYNPRISTSAPVGPINRNKLGRTGVMSPLYTVFRPHDIDTTYLEYFFKCGYWHSFMNFNGDSGARSDRFSIRDNVFFQMPIPIPDIDEQRKIGELLTCLDNLITLHQRKFEKLTNVKKSMLEKMFPQNGSSYPEIRFKGFTDPWEQREVGDLLIERSQQAPMSDEYPLMAFIANEGVAPKGERYDRSALVTDTVNKLYKKTEKGDFIYSSNNLETGSIGLNKYGKACISPVYSIFEPTGIADSDFLGRRLVRKDFINAMVKWRQGVIYGQWRIHESDFLKIEISVPSVEEQRKIGAYLDQLDNLITLHQRQPFLQSPPDISLIVQLTPPFYTFSWEQRKLGDIADIVGGGTPSTGNQSYWDGDIDWYAPAEIADQIYANSSQKKITGLGYENSSAKMLPPGTVLFTSRAGIGKTAILTRKGCTNQGFQSIVPHRGELDSYFIFSRTEELKRYGELVGAGSTFVEVSGKQMAVMELMMPPTMREQQTIGGFFQQLDHLITLHQRQTIVYAVIRSIRKVILAERQYFAPPMVRKSP